MEEHLRVSHFPLLGFFPLNLPEILGLGLGGFGSFFERLSDGASELMSVQSWALRRSLGCCLLACLLACFATSAVLPGRVLAFVPSSQVYHYLLSFLLQFGIGMPDMSKKW